MIYNYEQDIDFLSDSTISYQKSNGYYSATFTALRITILMVVIIFYLAYDDSLNIRFFWSGLIGLIGATICSILAIVWISNISPIIMNKLELSDYMSCAKMMLYYFCPNVLILPAFTFLLCNIKLDGNIELKWMILLIPLFIAQIISLIFMCFIIPGLMTVDENDGHESQ